MHNRRFGAAVIIAATAVLTACTSNDHPSANPPVGSSQTQVPADEKSEGPPLTISEHSLWDSEKSGIDNVDDTALVGDSVIIYGDDPGNGGELAVVDAGTGKPRWQVKPNTTLPGAGKRYVGFGGTSTSDGHIVTSGNGDDWTLLVPYTTDCPTIDCDSQLQPEQGIAGYDGRTGKLRWTSPIVPKGSSNDFELLAANDKIAVSAVSSGDSVDDPKTQPTVLATNVSNGKKLWQGKGVWPQEIVGDTVIGVRASRPDEPGKFPPAPTSGDDVVALSVSDGSQKWALSSSTYYAANLVTANDKVAIVQASLDSASASKPQLFAVDVATGKQLAKLGTATSCRTDGPDFVVCADTKATPQVMKVYDVPSNTTSEFVGEKLNDDVDLVHGDYVVMGDVIVDRKGRQVTSSPGTVAAMSDKYAVTKEGEVYGVKVG